jgi:poly-gamma-glutamate synthesis protein (capsule biosynthesis protein)
MSRVAVRKIFTILLFFSFVFLFSGCEKMLKEDDIVSINDESKKEQPAFSQQEKEEEEVMKETDKEEVPLQEEMNREVDICFMGDVMMDSYIGQYIKDQGVDYPWTDVSSITNEADLSIINLETSVSTRGKTKKPKGYGFRSAPYTVQGLVNSGIDVVSIANNHILDFGTEAFFDTMDTLKQYGIEYVGGGKNQKEAEKPIFIEKNGIKIGFVAYTSIVPYAEWRAGENNPGIASLKPQDFNQALDNIKKANEQCDLLMVVVHWGKEYAKTPQKWQTELAHQMIDYGADAIIGHHPHILQGIEFYKEKPILYSIGNFIFLKNDDSCGKTGIFKLTFDQRGFKEGMVYPVNIQYCKANLLTHEGEKGTEVIHILRTLSESLGTDIAKDGQIQRKQ